jgi:ATP-dependent Clp protease ATP-binding subunit ClpC
LTDEELLQIVGLLVDQINKTLRHRRLALQLTPEAKQWIVDQTCTDRSYGARPLRRALQKYVEDPLAEAVIQGRIGVAQLVEVYLDGGTLNFRPIIAEDLADRDEVLVH